jgi:hypothetical protein
MRRLTIGLVAAVVLLGAGGPAGADESTDSQSPGSAFSTFSVFGQSQVATTWLYAVGEEEEHIAGAMVAVDKPENVAAVAAAFQRGTAAGYTYGATVGGGSNAGAGGKGIAPEPPPGEADGQYPSSPDQMTWEGTLTSGAKGTVIDGRAHAKATGAPSGVAQFTLQQLDVAGQLTVKHAVTASRGAPTAAGLEGESTSLLRGITIGNTIKIDTLISTTSALMPATSGETKAAGRTVVQGASVNGVPVEIGDTGIRISDQGQGTAQKGQLDDQLAKGLASANIEDIRLARATTKKGDDGSVRIDAPSLVIKYRDKVVAANNPQGFSGGGLGLGGAALSLQGERAEAVTPDSGTSSTEQHVTRSRDGGGNGTVDGGPRPDHGVRVPRRAAWGRPRPAAGGDPGLARPEWRREVDAVTAYGRRPAQSEWLRSID